MNPLLYKKHLEECELPVMQRHLIQFHYLQMKRLGSRVINLLDKSHRPQQQPKGRIQPSGLPVAHTSLSNFLVLSNWH